MPGAYPGSEVIFMKYYKIPSMDGEDIIFRLISAEEADRFIFSLKQEDNPYIEEYIFNLITDNKYVNKEGQLDILAGIVPLTIYTSLKLSGVLNKKMDFPDIIERYRKVMSTNTYYPIYGKIISLQNGYTLDALKTKTLNELIELLAFSEMMDGKPLFDTAKMIANAKQEEEAKGNVAVKRGVKGISKQELDALRVALQSSIDD